MLLATVNVSAQNIDSLAAGLRELPADSSKIRPLLQAANLLHSGSEKTRPFAEEAISLSRKFNFPGGEIEANLALANVYFLEKNWETSLEHAKRAAETAILKNKFPGNPMPFAAGAAALHKLGKKEEAVSWMKRSNAAAKTSPPETRAALLNCSAVLFANLQKTDSAKAYLAAARKILEAELKKPGNTNTLTISTLNDVASNEASLILEAGDFENAEKKFHECYRADLLTGDKNAQCLDLLNLAAAQFAQRHADQAAASLEAAREILLFENDGKQAPPANFTPPVFNALNRPETSPGLRKKLKELEERDVVLQLENRNKAKERELKIEAQLADLQRARRERIWLASGLAVVSLLSALFFWQRSKTRRANRQLEIRNAEIARQAEKLDLLMRELHHRVKNNLQMVSSLLNLQSQQVADEKAAAELLAGRLRVDAMSLIHQRLYRSEGVSKVDFSEFARDLTDKTAFACGFSESGFELKTHFSPPEIEVDKALPIGLILNELLTNSFKYAFSKTAKPSLEIRLENAGEKHLRFFCRDNGPGLPENFSPEKSETFGMRLAHSFSGQVGGKARFWNDGGLCFEVVFVG